MEKTYTNEIKALGYRIKKLRELRSLTQQDLADRCEVDIRTVQRIERGDFGFGMHIFFALAEAFDVKPYQLLDDSLTNN